MNKIFLVGLIMGVPPWGMLLGKFGITIQIFGIVFIITHLIIIIIKSR